MSIATRIATFCKWSEDHGNVDGVSQEVIESMKRKNILFYDEDPNDYDSDYNSDDEDNFNAIDTIDYIKYIMEDCPYPYEIGIITFSYVYNEKLFGIKQFGIEKLQKKWREYSKKLTLKKSIKNLRHREIYGKYPKYC